MAAVMFLTSYAVVLAAHDVRMDALLAGFVAFGLWQLLTYLETGRTGALVLGAIGVGLAFSAKGMIAVAVSGVAVFFHVWAKGQWRRLWSPKAALGVVVFFLTISPILYCYYLQFDLHPEKVIEGRTGVSGVRFILFGQSVERLAGGKGGRHSRDVLFLFHSLLWAFLPWSLLTFAAWSSRFRALARGRWAAFRAQEQLTFLGVFVSIAFLSFSRYKLAHYLNAFFPMLAVFTAGWMTEVYRSARWRSLEALRRMQTVVLAVLLVLVLGVLNGWAFPPRNGWVVAGALVLGALLALGFRLGDRLQKVWVPSALAITLVNFVQNANYHPALGEAQVGAGEAAELLAEDIDWSRTYFLIGRVNHPIQLYARRIIPSIGLAQVRGEIARGKVFLLVPEQGRAEVREAGLPHAVRREFRDCRVMSMRLKVLNPRTRDEAACEPVYLLAVGG
jgi:4-amino-4-deoxy-L-arabinose transferase-like glycosyltransferase